MIPPTNDSNIVDFLLHGAKSLRTAHGAWQRQAARAKDQRQPTCCILLPCLVAYVLQTRPQQAMAGSHVEKSSLIITEVSNILYSFNWTPFQVPSPCDGRLATPSWTAKRYWRRGYQFPTMNLSLPSLVVNFPLLDYSLVTRWRPLLNFCRWGESW